MNEAMIRAKIHQAVDANGASLQEDPYLAQRIIAQNHRKEGPRMKKLSAGMIVAIVLMLLSVTAVAVGLTVEDFWQQAFDKMGTWGIIWNIGEPTADDLPLEKAADIAREALKAEFGVTDEELDAMGFYPSYFEAEVDDGTAYPSEWRFLWSSRTNVNIEKDDDDHGPNGEYRVYMYAETGEIYTTIFYTTRFWDYAQRVWDVGNYDEVYWHYGQTDFFNQPDEVQEYWTKLLAEKGYDVITEEEKLHRALNSAELDLQFCELSRIADNNDPLVAAAWQALEDQVGLKAETLQKYAYVATVPSWNTGYDDVCIHYSYEVEWDMMSKNFLDSWSDHLFTRVNKLGLYMVSFEKGTTNVAAITHVLRSETTIQEPVTEGGLLARTDWEPADLVTFDEAFTKLDRAVKRMRAAGLTYEEIEVVVDDFLRDLGGEEEYYPEAPAEANVEQWFAEESEWDAKITEPDMTYEQFTAKYGSDERFWPMELHISLDPSRFRMPKEGETTIEEAIQIALEAIIAEKGQEAIDSLGDYTVNAVRYSLTADPDMTDCRWEVYFTDDPTNPLNGWRVNWGEWEDEHPDAPYIQHITDRENG